MIAFGVLALAALGGLLALIPIGLRAGDHPGDVGIVGISPGYDAVSVALCNPGRLPVIVGLSLRRPGLRLRLEAGSYVSRTRAAAPLPAVVGVLGPGETGNFVVAASPRLGGRAELLVLAGQRTRLRAVHRAVRVPAAGAELRRRGDASGRRRSRSTRSPTRRTRQSQSTAPACADPV